MNHLRIFIIRFRERAALDLGFIGFTGLLCFLAWLGNSFLQNSLQEIDEGIVERSLMLGRQKALQDVSLQLENKLKVETAVLRALQSKFPEIPEESQFLQALSERASDMGIRLGEFRPGGIIKGKDCMEIELRLRSTGQYSSVCRWLDSLTDVPRFVRVSNIALTGPSTPGGDCVLDIQLNLLFGLSNQPQIAAVVKP